MLKTVIGVAMFLVLLLQQLSANPEAMPHAGLEGSKHDFSGEPWAGGDLCIACHAPGRQQLPDAPLWGPSTDFNRMFADAARDTRQRRSRPGPGSLVCLRCHDGSMAADMFGSLAPPAAHHAHHPRFNGSGHGGTNHPVGVAYPAFDRDFRPLSAVLAERRITLPDGQVECVSCHDPHNEEGHPYMLVQSNRRSALCLACHRK